jgi:hypothetical protein
MRSNYPGEYGARLASNCILLAYPYLSVPCCFVEGLISFCSVHLGERIDTGTSIISTAAFERCLLMCQAIEIGSIPTLSGVGLAPEI